MIAFPEALLTVGFPLVAYLSRGRVSLGHGVSSRVDRVTKSMKSGDRNDEGLKFTQRLCRRGLLPVPSHGGYPLKCRSSSEIKPKQSGRSHFLVYLIVGPKKSCLSCTPSIKTLLILKPGYGLRASLAILWTAISCIKMAPQI